MSREDAKSAKDEPDLDVDRSAHFVIGAAIEVHRHLGPRNLEGVYEEAIALEFGLLINFDERTLREGVQRVVLTD